MTSRPSLPLYARDWIADTEVTAMGAVARAGYLDLLCRCWIDGSIPAPDGSHAGWSRLAALARLTVAELRRVWPLLEPHFVTDEQGRLRNSRLERHRAEADGYSRTKADAGRKGAVARWQTHGTDHGRRDGKSMAPTMAKPMAKAWPASASAVQTPSDSEGVRTPASAAAAAGDQIAPSARGVGSQPDRPEPEDPERASLARLADLGWRSRLRANKHLGDGWERQALTAIREQSLTVDVLDELLDEAKAKTTKGDPMGLFGRWIDRGEVRTVLAERHGKKNHEEAEARGRIAQAAAARDIHHAANGDPRKVDPRDALDGVGKIYGEQTK